jgi:hypothetical protein
LRVQAGATRAQRLVREARPAECAVRDLATRFVDIDVELSALIQEIG